VRERLDRGQRCAFPPLRNFARAMALWGGIRLAEYEWRRRKTLLSSSSVVVCLSISLLAACGRVRTAIPVAMSPTGTSIVAAFATPSLTPMPIPTAIPTPMPASAPTQAVAPAIPAYSYKAVNSYPHDPNAFTQGLVFENGVLYEGTGLRGRSTLRRVELETGDILQVRELPARFFGEGVTVYGNKVVQLTWQSNVGFVYDKDSFDLLQEFDYPTEGWGITHDGKHLIMSDGTSTLNFLDPETFQEVGRIEVCDNDGPVTGLNELEYVEGEIYANVWPTDRIARIAPQTGRVIGWIELKGLLGPEERSEPIDVLNGIAYDAKNGRLFVTGKLWPRLFEIELISLDQGMVR